MPRQARIDAPGALHHMQSRKRTLSGGIKFHPITDFSLGPKSVKNPRLRKRLFRFSRNIANKTLPCCCEAEDAPATKVFK